MKPARRLANSLQYQPTASKPSAALQLSKNRLDGYNFLVSAPALVASYSSLAPALAIVEWARSY